MTLSEWTAVAALGLNILVAAIGLTWGLARIREAVSDEIELHKEKFDGEVAKLRREFGEVAAALRQKVVEVELWSRDNLVKKNSFEVVTDRISQEVKDFAERIDRRLERMEEKIDHQP